MPILNYTSKIALSQTVGEIQAMLGRRGVTRISTLLDGTGAASGLACTMRTDFGLRDYELPVNPAGVLAVMQADPLVRPGAKTNAQATRTAWRIAKDWLESQLALVDARLAELDQVMLPYLVTGYDQATDRAVTVYDQWRGSQAAIEARGDAG